VADIKLAEFQEAAAQLIADRLLDRNGSRRFLLADEVGLGKTIVARAVLEELLRRRRTLDVVYLCSNAEIAEQNRKKLDPAAGRPLRRVTELALGMVPERELRLFSFTPGTSLREGTGLAWERRLLLFLVHRVLRQDVRKGEWREYFRCGADKDQWPLDTQFRRLRPEFRRKLSLKFQELVEREWNKPVNLNGKRKVPAEIVVPAKILADEVRSFRTDDSESRRRRNRLVGVLRLGVKRVALDDLNPDIVILDEVQRFREVITQASQPDSIAARLFKRGTAVLILSATPYRMFALDHEGSDHYKEFLDTVQFLFAASGAQEVGHLRSDLDAFRERLEKGEFLDGHDALLLEFKQRVEHRLQKVISRTERNWYIEGHGKGVEEVKPSGEAYAIPRSDELTDFVRLRRFLLDKVDTTQHITEYWKSCPAPLTFMDAQYAPMRATRHSKKLLPTGLVAPPKSLSALADRSLRFRELFRLLFGARTSRWRYLWTRPSYLYYRDEFFGEIDPLKVLVFSGWRFVPKAIALLASYEAEERIKPGGRIWSQDDKPPLRFTEKGSFHVFDVCFPSPALARLVEPAALATEALTSSALQKSAERALRGALDRANVEVSDTSSSPSWAVVARLEAQADSGVVSALESSGAYSAEDVTERFRDHVRDFADWIELETPLRISHDRFRQIAEVAAFSPANALLRAFWSVYPDTRNTLPPCVVDVCFRGLRGYFNKRTVRAVVEEAVPGRGFARAVLRYCALGHFQAVADEYLFLMRDVLQRRTPTEAAGHLGRVLGIGIGTPNINITTTAGNGEERLKHDPVARRSHFALAFGEDVQSEQRSPLEQSYASRKTAVREAFNSPFWPFVLATTSVGQEGLDFHLFCRDVVHWNLPSNPVDLEQREGRISRRDGLALRRTLAADWSLERVSRLTPQTNENVWNRVFAAIDQEPGTQRYKHGLFPHWIYTSPDPTRDTRIRRHLFFYTNSQDAGRYEELKERLALYRLVFGQPRQQDLLDRIRRKVDTNGKKESHHSQLARYMINLSPMRQSQAYNRSCSEAAALVANPAALEALLADAETVERTRKKELSKVASGLSLVKATVRDHLSGRAVPNLVLAQAARALCYLRNPDDALFDEHLGLGLEDDCEVIADVAQMIRSAQQ
jgi:hypothetical protein